MVEFLETADVDQSIGIILLLFISLIIIIVVIKDAVVEKKPVMLVTLSFPLIVLFMMFTAFYNDSNSYKENSSGAEKASEQVQELDHKQGYEQAYVSEDVIKRDEMIEYSEIVKRQNELNLNNKERDCVNKHITTYLTMQLENFEAPKLELSSIYNFARYCRSRINTENLIDILEQ